MVIMPLISGGVLHKVARQFGVNLPEMGGSAAKGAYSNSSHGGGYYGSDGYGDERGGGGSGGGLSGLVGGMGGLASMAKMAQAFM